MQDRNCLRAHLGLKDHAHVADAQPIFGGPYVHKPLYVTLTGGREPFHRSDDSLLYPRIELSELLSERGDHSTFTVR
jgi:hypothetical protein